MKSVLNIDEPLKDVQSFNNKEYIYLIDFMGFHCSEIVFQCNSNTISIDGYCSCCCQFEDSGGSMIPLVLNRILGPLC